MNDTHTKARATAQALIKAHIPPNARGVDRRALYYALVAALTEVQQDVGFENASSSEARVTETARPGG